jgi:hypothetical protein
MPQKTSGIIERVQEILNREYTRAWLYIRRRKKISKFEKEQQFEYPETLIERKAIIIL